MSGGCYNGAQVHMRKLLFPICGALFLLLTGCSEPTKTTEKKKEEKLEPATGQSALYKMYQVARSWAPDAQVLKMNSILMTEVKDLPPGTAGAWQGTFTSAARSQARSYTYSIVEGEGNLHKGALPDSKRAIAASRRQIRRSSCSLSRSILTRHTRRPSPTQAPNTKEEPGKADLHSAGESRQVSRPRMARHLG